MNPAMSLNGAGHFTENNDNELETFCCKSVERHISNNRFIRTVIILFKVKALFAINCKKSYIVAIYITIFHKKMTFMMKYA